MSGRAAARDQSATHARRDHSDVARANWRLRVAQAVFGLFCVAVVVRVLGDDSIINQYVYYSSDGGSFPEKIHPANYLFALCGLTLYATVGLRWRDDDLPVLRAVIALVGYIALIGAFNVLRGRASSAGYLLDTYIFTGLVVCLMLALPPLWRARIGWLVVGLVLFNSALSLVEFVLGARFVRATVAGEEFRPSGFFGAALNVGVINLTTMVMFIALRMNGFAKAAGVALLAIAIGLSGSRTAMLMMAGLIPVALVIAAHQRREGMSAGVTALIVVLAAVIAAPIVYFAFSELGLLSRFEGGYIDDSAQTRIDVYRVFSFVGWRDILFGADMLEILKIVNEQLGIKFIESAIIFFVFDFGAIGAVIFVGLLLFVFWRLSRGAHPLIGLGLLTFVLVALTNNTLATKVPSLFIAMVMATGLRSALDLQPPSAETEQ